MELDADLIRKIADNVLTIALLAYFLRYFMREVGEKDRIIVEVIQKNTKVVEQNSAVVARNSDIVDELKEVIDGNIRRSEK